MSEPLSERMREGHDRRDWVNRDPTCSWDDQDWPCPTVQYADEVAQLEQVVEKAREVAAAVAYDYHPYQSRGARTMRALNAYHEALG